jgi:AcrR family transcriptional regulator
MPTRADVAEERRAQILAAAVAVFARLGFHPARMDDIARECGLSKGTLYLYFKGKDDLIAAILQQLFARELDELTAALAARDRSAGERLLGAARQMADELRGMAALQPIWFEFYALAARRDEVRRVLREYFAAYRARLAALVRQGMEGGEFRAVDPEGVATALIAIFEGLALCWGVDPQAIRVEEAGEGAVRLLLDGLRPPVE